MSVSDDQGRHRARRLPREGDQVEKLKLAKVAREMGRELQRVRIA